ncbi:MULTISPECIES: ATP phosphoribosyltransferase [Propionibacterium]|uniref:ATP phosphoribosyltransferase n=2 Tax=Propionibacterium freudenreichii TaxID=1744 RepID=A0A0A8SJJ4_9ACTN|nr:ATP phosphoribosyltransferase [Propionibacterium freudenreichii]MDN5961874.1 ATP phosphoribosyltransferase [Propionibacterium sp.]AJQ91042.1 ATP phosphoribosyltransferase [Propionibacterium freudenreichii subsp. freudenreichii]ARO12177.1 ATP phosphoribosyltransferase [Propionibacterium freudenreichii]AWY95563.1 ATP phosphoribosyltransferase [Propionibacterium freudenreichii]MCT2974402.1 ATP phosphoribosyltransferase [Propionibacterium freudenreichii]
MSDENYVKIAVPNKGSLSEAAAQMLREAGYAQRTDSKELVLLDEANGVEFYYLRPRDIAVYVGEGTLDLGITGRDMLIDSGAAATEILPLGFGRSRFRFAAPRGAVPGVAGLEGKRIATSYPGLLRRYLDQHGLTAKLVHLDGAVESSIALGVADAIADVVQTGTTLRKAGLALFGDAILESEGILIRRSEGELDETALDHLTRRLSSVLVARSYVIMDYDCPSEILDQASALTPGFESPTVSPLAREGWVAVRSMVPSSEAQRLMDDLWDLGARAILVTEVAACRL